LRNESELAVQDQAWCKNSIPADGNVLRILIVDEVQLTGARNHLRVRQITPPEPNVVAARKAVIDLCLQSIRIAELRTAVDGIESRNPSVDRPVVIRIQVLRGHPIDAYRRNDVARKRLPQELLRISGVYRGSRWVEDRLPENRVREVACALDIGGHVVKLLLGAPVAPAFISEMEPRAIFSLIQLGNPHRAPDGGAEHVLAERC